MRSKGSHFCGMKLIYQIYPVYDLKISTFTSGLYWKYLKVSCIGISDEIKEKYESMHMKKTKVKLWKSPRNGVPSQNYFFILF